MERFLDSPFIADLGMRLDRAADGEAEVSVDIPPRLTNRVGGAHGGVIASVVDVVMAQAIRTRLPKGRLVATVEMKVNYLAPGRSATIRATGRTLRVGGTLGTATAEVFDGDGALLAVGSGTYRVLMRGASS
jgi:acyl-CoA thioesterase